MAHILKARVAETSTSTGTGDFTLSGAVTAHKTFASRMSVADTTEYVIYAVDGSGVPTGEWEEGTGTYSAANTLTRTTVAESSNSDAAVNFGAGPKVVIMTPLASRVGALIQGGAAGDVLLKTGTGDFAWGWSSLTDSIRATVLTGLSTATATVVNATHTVLEAIGFLQKQVSDNATAITAKQDTLVSGTSIKTVNGASLLGTGNLSVTADLTAPGPIGGTTPSTIAATGVTVTGGTVTASTPVINCTQTWNNAAVSFTGRLTNITNTASASTSLIEDWQLGGVSKLALGKDASLTLLGGLAKIDAWNGTIPRLSGKSDNTGEYWIGGGSGWTGGASMNITGSGNAKSSIVAFTQATARVTAWISSAGDFTVQNSRVIGSNSEANGSATITAPDVGWVRSAARVWKATDGGTSNLGDVQLRNLIATGRIDLPQYTTATRPAWVNGSVIFDTDLDKLVIGGVAAWEVVTSV